MNTQSFILYESVYKQFEIIEQRIGKEAACVFIKDVMNFGLYGEIPDQSSESWLYGFEQIITSISCAKNRYQTAIENGKKGGRPRAELNEQEVLNKKKELGTWKAVAQYYNISEQTLKNYRNIWNDIEPKENLKLKDQTFLF